MYRLCLIILKGNIQYDVTSMRRPGQVAVPRAKNGQQMDHGIMNKTAPGSKLKLSPEITLI